MATTLKVGKEWVETEIVSEPYVVMTFRGYAPVVSVKSGGQEYQLYISSRSISQALDPLVKANDGKFSGLKLRVRKESDDKMAPYVVEKV